MNIPSVNLLSSATAWYTAKRGVTSSGGLVSRWDNQIKYSNPYTQGT